MRRRLPSQAKTSVNDLASEIARKLKNGDNIYLSGELGSGKTTFTQFLLENLGSNDSVISPTFQLIKEYLLPNGTRLLHVDLYRLTSPDDLLTIGILDELVSPDSICVVEWPERGETVIPVPNWHLSFEHDTNDTRHVTVETANNSD